MADEDPAVRVEQRPEPQRHHQQIARHRRARQVRSTSARRTEKDAQRQLDRDEAQPERRRRACPGAPSPRRWRSLAWTDSTGTPRNDVPGALPEYKWCRLGLVVDPAPLALRPGRCSAPCSTMARVAQMRAFSFGLLSPLEVRGREDVGQANQQPRSVLPTRGSIRRPTLTYRGRARTKIDVPRGRSRRANQRRSAASRRSIARFSAGLFRLRGDDRNGVVVEGRRSPGARPAAP